MTDFVTRFREARARRAAERLAADKAFMDRALALDHWTVPPAASIDELVAKAPGLSVALDRYAGAVSALPQPPDRRLREVRRILERGVSLRREILEAIGRLGQGDVGALEAIARELRRWKESGTAAQLLLRDYAAEKLALAGKGNSND